MDRMALAMAALLVCGYVATVMGVVAFRDSDAFVRLLLGSLLVPGAVFMAGALRRRRRRASGDGGQDDVEPASTPLRR